MRKREMRMLCVCGSGDRICNGNCSAGNSYCYTVGRGAGVTWQGCCCLRRGCERGAGGFAAAAARLQSVRVQSHSTFNFKFSQWFVIALSAVHQGDQPATAGADVSSPDDRLTQEEKRKWMASADVFLRASAGRLLFLLRARPALGQCLGRQTPDVPSVHNFPEQDGPGSLLWPSVISLRTGRGLLRCIS